MLKHFLAVFVFLFFAFIPALRAERMDGGCAVGAEAIEDGEQLSLFRAGDEIRGNRLAEERGRGKTMHFVPGTVGTEGEMGARMEELGRGKTMHFVPGTVGMEEEMLGMVGTEGETRGTVGTEGGIEERGDSVDVRALGEVVVTGQSARQRISNGRLGSESLELKKLALTPKFFGESDIVKSIALLPGVHGESDGAGGFEVRGGNAYQNLVLLDGMTLYNPAHLMGIFSTFNDDAMSMATLHKGPIPVCFGGASSSVLETYMKPGSLSRYHFSGTVGLLNAKVAADGPIVKDKLSFSVAARRSYVDLFLKLIPKYRHTVMNFWDVNAKLHYKVNEGNTVDGSFFVARDNLAVSDLMTMNWGNLAGSVNWHCETDNNWESAMTGAVTDYTTLMGMNIMASNQEMTQYIRSFSLNEKVGHSFSGNHSIEFGARTELLKVKSGDMYVDAAHYLDIRSGWVNEVWAGYDGVATKWLTISAGCRVSVFSSLTGNRFHAFVATNEDIPEYKDKSYLNFEPRGSLRFNINDNHNVKAGVSVTSQNIHGIRSTSTTFPYDRYALTSDGVRPERITQYSTGYAGMTPDGGWDWSVEGYYKRMRNVYDFKDGMNMFSRVNLKSIILGGEGRSLGLEVMLRKNSGKLSGWISYTLSHTQTRILWIRILRNGEPYKWSVVDRRIASGGIINYVTLTSRRDLEEEDEKDKLIDGDSVSVLVTPIDQGMVDYLTALAQDSNGPQMWEGGFCLGYFLPSTVAERSIIYRPDEMTEFK